MKKILAVLAGLFIFVVILHLGLFFLINVKGKDFIVGVIEDNLDTSVSMDSFTLKFPFEVEVNNLRAGDMSLERASATISFFNPFNLKLTLGKVHIDGLSLTVKKDKQGIPVTSVTSSKQGQNNAENKTVVEPVVTAAAANSSPKPSGGSRKPAVLSLLIKNIYLQNGSVKIIDLSGQSPKSITIEDINLRLRNFTYPRLSKSFIDLGASLKTGKGDLRESIKLDGWVDYQNLDMDLELDVYAVDYLVISNFVSESFSPGSLGIQEAFLSLNAKISSKSNDMVIDGLLTVEEIAFFPKPQGQEDSNPNQDLVRTVLALLKGNQEKASLRFKLKTKMDSPNLDFVSIKESLQASLPINPVALAGTLINTAMDKAASKAESPEEVTIDNVIDSFKEMGENFKNMFKGKFK